MFIIHGTCGAQNLVPNGSFEDYSECPSWQGQIDSCLNWTTPSTQGTPDYYNQCASSTLVQVPFNAFGYQTAQSGNAYAGLFLWLDGNSPRREYIECPLTTTLTAGATYNFEMYVNLGNWSRQTTDAFGVYFSDTLVDGVLNNAPLSFFPQINNVVGNTLDSLNWILISANYTATGSENYLIIGNFKDDISTSLSVVNPGGTNASYMLVDNVSLHDISVGMNELDENVVVNFYPNPFSDKLNIVTKGNKLLVVKLYDISSREIINQSFTNSTLINTEQLAKGTYFYEVRNENVVINKGKIVKK